MNSTDALIAISDHILNSINSLNKLEYNKSGRKYKFIENSFQRIKNEDKHLMISDDFSMKMAIISSYNILNNINPEIFDKYPDFCLSIISVARELEINKWYEVSNIINYSPNFEFDNQLVKNAINFSLKIKPKHLEMGYNLMIASKINFFHTDHHLGTKIYGFYLIKFMIDYFGEESINDADILTALKSFVHWGSIKLILYKLDLKVNITDDEFLSYKKFPQPLPELKEEIFKKYPSGTSKYNLIKKSLFALAQHPYGEIIPFPNNDIYDLNWIFEICKDIETDPLKYHLRSKLKNLSINKPSFHPPATSVQNLLNFIVAIITLFDLEFDFITKTTKLPKFEDIKDTEMLNTLKPISDQVIQYREKDWGIDDVSLRLKTDNSLSSVVDQFQQQWSLSES